MGLSRKAVMARILVVLVFAFGYLALSASTAPTPSTEENTLLKTQSESTAAQASGAASEETWLENQSELTAAQGSKQDPCPYPGYVNGFPCPYYKTHPWPSGCDSQCYPYFCQCMVGNL